MSTFDPHGYEPFSVETEHGPRYAITDIRLEQMQAAHKQVQAERDQRLALIDKVTLGGKHRNGRDYEATLVGTNYAVVEVVEHGETDEARQVKEHFFYAFFKSADAQGDEAEFLKVLEVQSCVHDGNAWRSREDAMDHAILAAMASRRKQVAMAHPAAKLLDMTRGE